MERKATWSKTKIDLLVDGAIFLVILAVLDRHLTGQAIHEWLGIAAGGAIIVHLLLHWDWIVGVTRRLFGKLPGASRLNYAVNALFFITLATTITSGLFISETALPLLGIATEHHDAFWQSLHTLASTALLYTLGLHVALHWKWIGRTVNRYLLKPALAAVRGALPRRDAGVEVRP
jgi:hypothetical protein